MPVAVVGLSHHSSPVEMRERFAFGEGAIPGVLKRLRDSGLASEGVLLSTCNRVELYAVLPESASDQLAELRRFLIESARYEAPVGDEIYVHQGAGGLEHLFKVACGIDSMVLGETEILGQLKQAYKTALHQKCTGSFLNRAFQKAFNVAKHIRTETNIQRGNVSVASVSVDLSETIFDTLKHCRVMVIGAGDTSEKTARALSSRGAQQILVTNRSLERAQALAAALDGEAIGFDEWAKSFDQVDIVISSTSAPHYVLDRPKLEPLMRARRNRPLLLIDIAVPRDIDPEVNTLEDVYLYNIDDLQAIADDCLQHRREEIDRCLSIIRERVATLLEATRQSRPEAKRSEQAADSQVG